MAMDRYPVALCAVARDHGARGSRSPAHGARVVRGGAGLRTVALVVAYGAWLWAVTLAVAYGAWLRAVTLVVAYDA